MSRTTDTQPVIRAKWNPFSASTWIAWLGATVFAALTIVAYAYAVFETKDESKAKHEAEQKIIDTHHTELIQRMDRFENKLDKMNDQIMQKGN